MSSSATGRELRLVNVSKRFDDVVAVRDVDLAIEPSEFVCLLGPSGCGKTTTLRMISGFEHPDEGQIALGDEDITYRPPHRRNIGMVFQNYALFPHMTVRDNVAFGLRMRKVPRAKAAGRVARAMEMVRLSGLERRYPKQLSGGQQQRVALARALVIEPSVLLLDEPLSNLDARLRVEMRVELKLIQREVGITTVFVTHDQEEALTVSDRIVVMNHGEIVQMGTPVEVYERPANGFVADFLGQENSFAGRVEGMRDGRVTIRLESGQIVHATAAHACATGDRVLVVLRKERLGLAAAPPAPANGVNAFTATVQFVNYLGSTIQYLCSVDGRMVVVVRQNDAAAPPVRAGERVIVSFAAEDCLCLKAPEVN